MKGYTWLNNLSQIPTHFVTSYYVLCVYTQPIVNCIRPRLQYVIEWVQNHCITTINNESDRLMRLAHKHMEVCLYTLHMHKHFIVPCSYFQLKDMIWKDLLNIHSNCTKFKWREKQRRTHYSWSSH